MSGHIQFPRSQCPFFLRSLVPSVQWQMLQSAKMNLAVAQAQPTWNLAWQKMPWQPSRHSVGIPCQTAALWEFMSRKILGQVDSASKWGKLQALQHATHVQISICPMFHRTTHLSARRYTEKRELMDPRSWEPSDRWKINMLHRVSMFSLNSSESHCKKPWLILRWWIIFFCANTRRSCSTYSIQSLWQFPRSSIGWDGPPLDLAGAVLWWHSRPAPWRRNPRGKRGRRGTVRDWASPDWVIPPIKAMNGGSHNWIFWALKRSWHWSETDYSYESVRRSWCEKHFFRRFVKGQFSEQ